jgi:hypothetical protein
MKRHVFILSLLVVLTACTTPTSPEPATVQGTQELILTDDDLTAVGLSPNTDPADNQVLRIPNGTNCRTETTYGKNVTVENGAYTICTYTADDLNNTEITVETRRFKDQASLNGSYQYESSHLFSEDGLISRDELGDQSTFRKNSDQDYGGANNNESMHYYHLWATKDLYYVHVTSSGSDEARSIVRGVAERTLAKLT